MMAYGFSLKKPEPDGLRTEITQLIAFTDEVRTKCTSILMKGNIDSLCD